MRVQSIMALAVVALAIAACGGGGGTSAPSSVVPGGNSTPAATATTPSGSSALPQFKVTITTGASSSSKVRQPKEIAAGSNSITFTLLQTSGTGSVSPQTFPLTNCAVSCTLSVSAPTGTDVFLVQTFSSSTGTGSMLSSGALSVAVVQNSTTTASISLNGTVSNVVLAATSSYLGQVSEAKARGAAPQAQTRATLSGGYITSASIYVIALDNQNNVILNPTTYSEPITLQQTFDYGYNPDVTLSVTSAATGVTSTTSAAYGTLTVTSPSDKISATSIAGVTNPSFNYYLAAYFGSSTPAPASTAYPSPLPSSIPELQLSVTLPSPLTVSTNPWNITSSSAYNDISGGSGGGTYTLSAPGCTSFVNLNVYYNYIYATPTGPGSCTATLSDSAGDTLSLPITVTTVSVSGS